MPAVAELVAQRTGLACRFLQGGFADVARLTRQRYYFVNNPLERLIGRESRPWPMIPTMPAARSRCSTSCCTWQCVSAPPTST